MLEDRLAAFVDDRAQVKDHCVVGVDVDGLVAAD